MNAKQLRVTRKYFNQTNAKLANKLLKHIPHHIGYVNFFKGGEQIG